MNDYLYWCVVLALGFMAGVFTMYVAVRARLKRQRIQVEDALALKQQAWGQYAAIRDELKLAQESVEKERRIAKAHIDTNEAFQKRSEEAWTLYQNQGIMAGNAQAMLFRELERAVLQLNEYRIKDSKPPLKVNPSIGQMISEFKGAHVHNG